MKNIIHFSFNFKNILDLKNIIIITKSVNSISGAAGPVISATGIEKYIKKRIFVFRYLYIN